MALVLPPLTRRHRVPAAIFSGVFIGALYELPLHVRVFPATRLWPTFVDNAVPFLDWTVWIYCSYFVFLFLPFAVCRDDARAARVLYGLMANSVLAGVVFLVWPTTGVVQQPVMRGVSGLLWSALLTVDRPANYFPSLHVANVCVCALALSREGNTWRRVAVVWTTLIVVSTLTTKQHFFIDLPAGLSLGAFCFWLVGRGVRAERSLH